MSEHLTHYTTDHDEIQEWAEARKARPAQVKSTETGEDEVGIIRLDFVGSESLEDIEWEAWFEKFDESGLALIYQEHTAEGQLSNFNKLIKANPEEAKKHGSKAQAATKKSPTKKAVKKAPVKTTAVKKSAPTKSAPKKAAPKKSAPKKAAPKKAAVKKSAVKKAVAKNAVKKAAPKKAVKKAVKKTATKKSRR